MNGLQMDVQGAKRYSFTDDKSGRLVEGINVFYYAPVKENDANTVGKIPLKVTLPIQAWGEVSKMTFPRNCQPIIEQSMGNKGVVSKVVGLKAV